MLPPLISRRDDEDCLKIGAVDRQPAFYTWWSILGLNYLRPKLWRSLGRRTRESCNYVHLGRVLRRLSPARASERLFHGAGSRQSGAEAPGTEGSLGLSVEIAASASFEMVLALPLALIACTT
jgi:hypothetical protein